MGRYILSGLELFIVSDIIETALSLELADLVFLGLLVAIRSAISYFFEREFTTSAKALNGCLRQAVARCAQPVQRGECRRIRALGGHLRLTLTGGRSKRFVEEERPARGRPPSLLPAKEPLVDDSLRDYLPILILLAMAVGLGLILILAAAVLAVRNPDPEKVSAYECGFNAFDDARMKFDVRFYLVSILFIIFDLEVAFLFPWAVAFGDVSMVGFWSMMVFLAVLTIGFAYEWKKGALEWE